MARTANVACIVGNVVGIATVTCLAAGLFPSDLDDTCRAPRSPQDALAGMEDLYSTYGLGVLIGLAPYIVLGAFTLVARISPALGETKRESRRRTVAVRWMSGDPIVFLAPAGIAGLLLVLGTSLLIMQVQTRAQPTSECRPAGGGAVELNPSRLPTPVTPVAVKATCAVGTEYRHAATGVAIYAAPDVTRDTDSDAVPLLDIPSAFARPSMSRQEESI